MEQGGGGDNVIYVQVDEQGRVLNYTSNMSGNEQVILLQDSGSGQQPVLVEAPGSTSGPLTSPSQTSQLTESVVVTSNQPASLQQSTGLLEQQQQQIIMGERLGETQPTVVSQSAAQPTLVDQTGTPVMLIGQPQPVPSVSSVSASKTVTSSVSSVDQVVSSQVVDQSGVPVVVLGATSAPRPAAPGISIINRPQIISHQGGSAQSIIKKPIVQRSLIQGQKVVSRFPRGTVPGGSVFISKQGKTYLATSKPIGQPGIATAAPHKIGQTSSNLLSRPAYKTASGPVILSTKPKSNLPQTGVSGVVLVSRPHIQIASTPLILSKQKSQFDTKTSGVLTFSPSINVSQPVLTVIKEPAKTHQTSEVTSTVNGTEQEEMVESDPIEIPDTDEEVDDEETSKGAKLKKDEATIASAKDTEGTGEEVLQDVTMNVTKEDEKSEEELVEEATTAEQKEVDMSEKVQQDMDSDLLMYLGGDTVKQDEDKGIISSMAQASEGKSEEQQAANMVMDVQTTDEVIEKEIETESRGSREESDEQMEDDDDNRVTDDEFEDEDDDSTLPAGLIRGEPIRASPKGDSGKSDIHDIEMDQDEPEKKEVIKASTEEVKKDALDTDQKSKDAEVYDPNDEEQKEVEPDVDDRSERDVVSEEATSTQDDNQEPVKSEKPGGLSKELQEAQSTLAEKDDGPGKPSRQKGRGRKSGNKKDATDTPEEVNKKSFMANFNLVSPREMEKLSQRRSKRVSNAEAVKLKEEEDSAEGGTTTDTTSSKVISTVKTEGLKKFFDTPRSSSYKSYKTLDDESSSRQNIFELFDSKDVEKDDSVDSLKARIQKLLAVNAELKTRLRESNHKAASNQTSNARFHEIKALQHKVEKLEKKNTELSQRLESYEGKPSPPERTVDVSFRMGRLSFKSPVVSTGAADVSHGVSPGKSKPNEGQEKPGNAKKSNEAALEKKELKLRALDQELDQRMAMLKTKEGKLQRVVMDVKSREKKVEYQESAIERRVNDIEYRERMLEGKTKVALEKMNRDGGGGAPAAKGQQTAEDTVRSAEMKRFEQELVQRKLKEREVTLKEREDAVAEKEKYLEVTEKELAALGADLKEQFHSIKITGKGSKAGKLPSSLLGKGRQRKSLPDEQQKNKSGSERQVGKKSLGTTSTMGGKTKEQSDNKDQTELAVLELTSPVVSKHGKKASKEEQDSVSTVSSDKNSSVSTGSGKKGRPGKKQEDVTPQKTPKNLLIDMNDKPSSVGRARPATTRRSIGGTGKATTPKSTLCKRTRTVSPAPVTTKQRVLGKKARK